MDFLLYQIFISYLEEMFYGGGEEGFSYGAFAEIFLGLLVGHSDGSFEPKWKG